MKKIAFLLFIISTLISCATSQKYAQNLNEELGKTKQSLIDSYGMPTREKRLSNGDEIITYISVNTQVIPASNFYFNNDFMTEDEMFYPFTYGATEIPISNYMGDVVTDYCKTDFYLKNNTVTSWQYQGNACVAL